jgi:hypothetical protein
MNVRFNVVGVSLDRRTVDLHRRHDSIVRQRFAWKVARNRKELKRVSR